jgi:hypothetical protein
MAEVEAALLRTEEVEVPLLVEAVVLCLGEGQEQLAPDAGAEPAHTRNTAAAMLHPPGKTSQPQVLLSCQ